MAYEIQFWKDIDYQRGMHLATVNVDIGRVYDDWETSRSDPGHFLIGAEGEGIASLAKYGSLYLYEHILSTEILVLCNWRQRTGSLHVGLTGSGVIYSTKGRGWNNTNFLCEVTRKV